MKAMTGMMMLVLLSLPVMAANDWTGAGGDNLWTTSANWTLGYPDTANQMRIFADGSVVNVLPGDAITVNRMVFMDTTANNATATVNYMGGTFTCTGYWMMGYFSTTSTEPNEGCVLNLTGDAYVQSNSMSLGTNTNALINMNITDNARLYVTATDNTNYRYRGFVIPGDLNKSVMARVKISGSGVLEANNLLMGPGEDVNIDISEDGVLKVRGDMEASEIAPLITASQITVSGGNGEPVVAYDGTWTWVMDPNNSSLAKPNTPAPADGSAAYTVVDLSWTPGNASNTWDVYFGTDPANLSLLASGLTSPSYSLLPCLDFETQYFWRVNEFNGTVTIEGDLWDFTTRNFTQVFWFEYADQAALDNEWTADNSLIGVSTNPARGAASMAIVYDNTAAPYLSRAASDFMPYSGDIACTSGVAMAVWIYGDAGNTDDPIFVSLTDGTNTGTVVCPIAGITQATDWTIWDIDLRDFTADSPNLDMGSITSMTIGVGNPDSPAAGGTGTIYVDNVNLFPVRCLAQPASDLTGDCITDLADFAQMAEEWLTNGNFPIL